MASIPKSDETQSFSYSIELDLPADLGENLAPCLQKLTDLLKRPECANFLSLPHDNAEKPLPRNIYYLPNHPVAEGAGINVELTQSTEYSASKVRFFPCNIVDGVYKGYSPFDRVLRIDTTETPQTDGFLLTYNDVYGVTLGFGESADTVIALFQGSDSILEIVKPKSNEVVAQPANSKIVVPIPSQCEISEKELERLRQETQEQLIGLSDFAKTVVAGEWDKVAVSILGPIETKLERGGIIELIRFLKSPQFRTLSEHEIRLVGDYNSFKIDGEEFFKYEHNEDLQYALRLINKADPDCLQPTVDHLERLVVTANPSFADNVRSKIVK